MKGKQMAGFTPRDQALRDFYQAWTTEEVVELVPLAEAAGRICSLRRQTSDPYPVYIETVKSGNVPSTR